MKKIKRYFGKIKKIIDEKLEKLSTFLYVIIFIMVIFICSQATSFCIIYIQLLKKSGINILLFKYINIWGIVSPENLDTKWVFKNSKEIKTEIEFLMNIAIALSGLLLSLITFISFFKNSISFKRKSCFKKTEIFDTGTDDIQLMCQYFDRASFVAVYSQSFEWVKKSKKIQAVFKSLAQKNKLKLYTGNDMNDVKEILKESCNEKVERCLSSSKNSLRFSYIERNNTKYVLYRQEEDEHIYVICVRENKESEYLLEVISQLVR